MLFLCWDLSDCNETGGHLCGEAALQTMTRCNSCKCCLIWVLYTHKNGLVISKKFDCGIGLGLWLFSSASACCSYKDTPQERPYKELLQQWQRWCGAWPATATVIAWWFKDDVATCALLPSLLRTPFLHGKRQSLQDEVFFAVWPQVASAATGASLCARPLFPVKPHLTFSLNRWFVLRLVCDWSVVHHLADQTATEPCQFLPDGWRLVGSEAWSLIAIWVCGWDPAKKMEFFKKKSWK